MNIPDMIKRNRNVDEGDVVEVLAALEELMRSGVNTGPNYNLGSPFARPEPKPSRDKGSRTVLRLRYSRQ